MPEDLCWLACSQPGVLMRRRQSPGAPEMCICLCPDHVRRLEDGLFPEDGREWPWRRSSDLAASIVLRAVMKKRSRQEWREDILEHVRAAWPRQLSAYDIARRLRQGDRPSAVPGTGRGAQEIRGICEELAADGLLTRHEEFSPSAPYGKPVAVRYQAVMSEAVAA